MSFWANQQGRRSLYSGRRVAGYDADVAERCAFTAAWFPPRRLMDHATLFSPLVFPCEQLPRGIGGVIATVSLHYLNSVNVALITSPAVVSAAN
jgi:hypothetical protein